MSFGDAVAGSCGRDIVREVGSVYCRWHEDFSFVFHCPTLTGRTTTINKSHLLLLAIFATLRFYESEISQWVRYIIWVFLLVDKFCIYELIVGLRTRERKSGNSLWILLSGWSGQGSRTRPQFHQMPVRHLSCFPLLYQTMILRWSRLDSRLLSTKPPPRYSTKEPNDVRQC